MFSRHHTAAAFALAASLTASNLVVQAGEPQAVVQRFGDWTVTIQPGPAGSGVLDRDVPASRSTIRLVSQSEPADATELPPVPAQPEPAELAPVAATPAAPAVKTAATGVDCPVIEPARDPVALARQYAQVYDRIPFSRAEYQANPSYRHDTTVEFLFGQMRPTVVHRGSTNFRPAQPAMSMPYAPYSPYGFNSYNFPFTQGYYGQGQFGHNWINTPYSLW